MGPGCLGGPVCPKGPFHLGGPNDWPVKCGQFRWKCCGELHVQHSREGGELTGTDEVDNLIFRSSA